MNKKIYLILLSFLCVFINVHKVSATTCTYEMYPIGIDDDLTARQRNDIAGNSTVIIDTTNKKEATSISRFGNNENKKFSENRLTSYIKKHGCPPYIKRDGAGDLDKLSEKQFKDYLGSFYDKNKYHYPLVLVNDNGTETGKYVTTVTNYASSKWTALKAKGELNADQKNLENLFINNVKKSKVYDNYIAKNSTWKSYLRADDDKKELEIKKNELNTAKSDYCYFYCKNKCSVYSDNSAVSGCVSSCNATDKSKCEEAYNACAGDSYSEECIKNQLTSKGLDSNYTDNREASLISLENDVNTLNNTINSTAKVKPINLKYGEYKLQCSDVVELHKYWVLLEILAPILVIIFGTVDFFVSVISSNEEKIIKARQKFPKRLAAAFLLFLAASIVSIIVNLSTEPSARDKSLMYCIINGN